MSECLVCGQPVDGGNDCTFVHDGCYEELRRYATDYGRLLADWDDLNIEYQMLLYWARMAYDVLPNSAVTDAAPDAVKSLDNKTND